MGGSARIAPVLVASLLVLGGCAGAPTTPTGSPTASGPVDSSATPAVPAPTSTSPSASPSPGGLTLGPTGYGALLLGMTKAQARATGLVTGVKGTKGVCGGRPPDGHLAGAAYRNQSDLSGKLFFSYTTNKLVMIGAMSGVSTPEGIGLGSSAAKVSAAYPSWRPNLPNTPGVDFVSVPGNRAASYRIFVLNGHVTDLVLLSHDQDCAG